MNKPMAARMAEVLGENPELADEFYTAASEIVDDFDDYGPVLQANLDGAYDEETAIERMRKARRRLLEIMRRRARPVV